MTPLDTCLARLDSPKKGSDGNWNAKCPAHEDQIPSLSVKEGEEGRVLIKCFAGCAVEDVTAALGLGMVDLMPKRDDPPRPQEVHPSAPNRVNTVIEYEVRNPAGTLVAVHVRRDTPEGKRITWKRPDGTAGLGGMTVAALPLYGVDQLPPSMDTPVIVTEGEKAAAALLRHGYSAVGTVCGASAVPSDESLGPLCGRPVYLWPDKDAPGKSHMDKIADALARLGHEDVRRIDWEGAPPKGDAADLFEMEAATDELEGLLDNAKRISPAKRVPLFEPLEAILSRGIHPRWLVKGAIEAPSSCLIFGASGDGKSFCAVDLAAAVTTGGTWAGMEVPTSGTVFIIAGEGRLGLARRFDAWQRHHGRTIPEKHLYISSRRIELDDVGAAAVVEAVDTLAASSGAPPVLIIVDTFARALPAGADENGSKDTGAFMNLLDGIRDRYDCVVLAVHHSGHDRTRARGSTAIKATLDVEMKVAKLPGGDRTLEFTKVKDGVEPEPVSFRLRPVPLGVEEDGTVISSCVVEYVAGTGPGPTSRLTHNDLLGIDTLRTTIEANGGRPVTVDEWRPRFYNRHTGDNPDSKRRAFTRVREDLDRKRLIVHRGGLYSLPGPGTDVEWNPDSGT